TLISPSAQPQQESGGRRGGRLKEHIVEKKTSEFEDYGHQIAALAHSYAPDPQKMQAAFQQGNISFSPGGAPGVYQVTIKSYVKPNDSMVIVFQKGAGIQSVQIASYLSDPKDAVKISSQYSQLPNGPNHVSNTNIDGVSKQ